LHVGPGFARLGRSIFTMFMVLTRTDVALASQCHVTKLASLSPRGSLEMVHCRDGTYEKNRGLINLYSNIDID